MTDRIRWESDGKDGLEGHVGTLEPWAFQMWQSPCDTGDYVLGNWVLLAAFPRADGVRSVARDDPETLKAEAERWLEEFVSSLGAVFPPGPSDWQRFQVGEARDVLTRWDAGHDDSNIYDRERVLADQVRNLLAIVDQVTATAAATREDR